MIELVGRTSSTEFDGGKVDSTWRIPALSESLARRQARANERIKGRSGVEVTNAQKIEDGGFPGQKIYAVEVTADR